MPIINCYHYLQFRCSIVNCGKEFKLKTHLARHYAQAHGIAISSSSPRPIMKTRTAFYLHANPMTRLARIVCRSFIKPKKAARQTSYAINTQLVKQECKFIEFLKLTQNNVALKQRLFQLPIVYPANLPRKLRNYYYYERRIAVV